MSQKPRKSQVWRESVIASITQSLFVGRCPVLSHEHSWDGMNYSVQNSEGSRCTVAFADNVTTFVAAFYSRDSSRRFVVKDESHVGLLEGLPQELHTLAFAEALQYLLQNVDGGVYPVITAALWSQLDGDGVVAAEPWEQVEAHGGWLLPHFPCDDACWNHWQHAYGLSDDDIVFGRALARRKIASQHKPVRLTTDEHGYYIRTAESAPGLAAVEEVLKDLGFALP